MRTCPTTGAAGSRAQPYGRLGGCGMTAAALSPGDLSLALATAARPCRHPTATLAASILGSGLAFIDGSVMNVALPPLDRDFHPGPAGLSCLINPYLLTLPALILLRGPPPDHYARR